MLLRLILASLRTWTVRLLSTIGLLFVVVTFTPVLRWWATALAGPWTDARGDVLIVLGAGMITSRIPDPSSMWRAVHGAEAWHNGFRTVIVTGRDAAPVMKQLMVLQGVPEQLVLVEQDSVSTRENASRCAGILASLPGRKVLLTSDYHVYRALRCFRKAGLAVEPRPCPDALKRLNSPGQRWSVFLELLTETGNIAWYRWNKWI